MALYYQAPTQELIEKVAEELKKTGKITPPEWAAYVKTGSDRERPPMREDWWYVRAAAILRKVAVRGPIGVSKLRTIYGSRINRGHKKEKHRRTGGNIMRKVLQQLEAAQFVKQDKKSIHKGRRLAPAGMQLLDKVALTIQKNKPKAVKAAPQVEKPKVEAKPEPKVDVKEKAPEVKEQPKVSKGNQEAKASVPEVKEAAPEPQPKETPKNE